VFARLAFTLLTYSREKEIDKKIDAMAQTVSALAPLVPEPTPELTLPNVLAIVGRAIVEVGITDRIRALFRVTSARQISALEVRDELVASGFYGADYSNFLSTIHTVLRRLVLSGEIAEVSSPGGKKYQGRAISKPAATHPMIAGASVGQMMVPARTLKTYRRRVPK
jgi:hypothetical protein